MIKSLWQLVLAALVASAAVGCGADIMLGEPPPDGDTTLSGDDDDDSADAPQEFPEFDGATLVVHSPLPATIYDLGSDLVFDAEILDADGEPLDFDDIVWESDQLDEAILVGSYGEEPLDWGIHTITATAELPNGDRLTYAVGGVRVQSPYAGIYVGSMRMAVDLEFQGTPITAACVGGLNFQIDMTGEVLRGDQSSCSMELMVIGNIDVQYSVKGDVYDDSVDGQIGLDLMGFLEIPVDWEGGLDGEDFSAGFSGELNIIIGQYPMQGSLDAFRISPFVDPAFGQ